MVAGRRFGPLIALVVIGICVLIVRMYQVQVVEHEIWAREARNLVRSATIKPYLRGPILDRGGEVIVKDVEACSIEFVYREFRRKHPLGQVAHARSALEQRAVSLEEAAGELEPWAMELLEATPAQFDAFEKGRAVDLCGFEFLEVGKGEQRRRSRAGDLRFYVHGLLDLEPREWSLLKRELKQKAPRRLSWLELAAEVQDKSLEVKREELLRRFDTSLGRLEQLASELEVSGLEGELAASTTQSFWFLVGALERKRQEVEDAVIVDQFQAAAGFHPGRLEPAMLLECFELSDMVLTLGWDRARLERWASTTREVWLDNWRTFHVPAALIRAELHRKDGNPAVEALVGELSLLFERRPRTLRERRAQNRDWNLWRERDEVAVFVELEDLFEERPFGAGALDPCVPYLDPQLRTADLASGELPAALIPFEFAQQVALERPLPVRLDWRGEPEEPWAAPSDLQNALQRLATLYTWRNRVRDRALLNPPRPEYLDGEQLLPWIAELWQAQFQARLAASLALPELESGDESRAASAWPLRFSEGRRKLAAQTADYAIRDRSSRPERLHDDPEESVVSLLLRFREDYGGFSILPRTKRLALAVDEDGEYVASQLIGQVRQATLEEVIEQQPARNSLSSIMRRRERVLADQQQVSELVAQISRNDEMHGTSGVEGLCDPVLRGINGFSEQLGLQEQEEAGRVKLGQEKIDGLEVRLTLELGLQKAAQYVIEHPVLPSSESTRDDVWFRNPVGAIVLATVDGEILAAASGPKQPHEPVDFRDSERRYTYDRCFHRRQFQPIGSIFKPFAAAYALDRLGLSEHTQLSCAEREDGRRAGWGNVSCLRQWGHGDIALTYAIEHSCNAYFAQVGELYQTKERFVEMARMFGFDRQTGVTGERVGSGFGEDWAVARFRDSRDFSVTELQRGGNGLEVVEASPVQVARAAAGLATGQLPAMRIVKSIGGEPVPASFERVELSATALNLVRDAMRGVIVRGSAANKGLDSAVLGFDLAGKTGSADYLPMSNSYRAQLRTPVGSSPDMRKHTWFMGYFPADDPQFVVVVYLHDIGVTASRSAVHVAAQFLKAPAVQAYAEEQLR